MDEGQWIKYDKMPTPTELRTTFNEVIDENSTPIRITYYNTQTFTAASYDDEQLVNASGVSVSGGCILQPIGASDKQYIDQGLADWNDSKMFLAGSIDTKTNMQVLVGNNGSLYYVLPNGITRYDVSGTTIYQRVFVRKLVSGQHPGLT